MIEHAVDMRIERPVGDVFAFLTDERNHPRWDASSVSMKPDEPGPWRTGTTFTEVRRMGPRTMEFRSTVAALDRPVSMDIDSLTGPEFHGHWRLQPEGAATQLRWSCEMHVDGPGRLFAPLVAKSFRKGVDQSFARLKEIMEIREVE